MTGDPASNYVIERELVPFSEEAAERMRHHFLAWLIASQCRGVKFNLARLRTLAAAAPLNNDTVARREVMQKLSSRYNDMDFRYLAHLCGASIYLFGVEGVIEPGLMSSSEGSPKGRYDPDNPYLRFNWEKLRVP